MTMSRISCYLGLVWLCLAQTGKGADSELGTNCPLYVEEGEDVNCKCFALGNTTPRAITWLSHSSTAQLQLKAVSRQDNGSKFVCQMDHKYNKEYTLQVAYGPSNDAMSIIGPEYFVTDGTRTLILWCIAKETNPKPIINWLFTPCNHRTTRDNCTFEPNPVLDDNITITCRASNPSIRKVKAGEASYVIRLKYPPKGAPEITGHKEGEIRRSGDRLTCKVTGGKPLVSKVIFRCTQPSHDDQPDVHENNTVSSSLVLSVSEVGIYETHCFCTAVWEPEADLYKQTALTSFAVLPKLDSKAENDYARGAAHYDGDNRDTHKVATMYVIISALGAVIIVSVLLMIVVCLLCGKKLRRMWTEGRVHRRLPENLPYSLLVHLLLGEEESMRQRQDIEIHVRNNTGAYPFPEPDDLLESPGTGLDQV